MSQLLSPKQVARSIGVSESSLKRWCDQGIIATAKTPGGHRRLLLGDVVRFLRETKRPLVQPDAIGLPPGVGTEKTGSGDDAGETFVDEYHRLLAAGDSRECRRLVLDRYLTGDGIAAICEDLLAPSMHRIGDLWTCGEVEVYQERRACEVVSLALNDLRALMPTPPDDAPVAIGGTPAGDNYRLPSLMVEMVLLESKWQAISLGCDLPFETLKAAAVKYQPAMLWLSLTSSMGDSGPNSDLEQKLTLFAEQLPESVRLVLGGRAIADLEITELPRSSICRELSDIASVVSELQKDA